MKLGAEDKKKVYALGVLGVIMAIAVYSSLLLGLLAIACAAPRRGHGAQSRGR